jgi:hypothetical protein
MARATSRIGGDLMLLDQLIAELRKDPEYCHYERLMRNYFRLERLKVIRLIRRQDIQSRLKSRKA